MSTSTAALPIPTNLRDYILKYENVNLNNTVPAPPGGSTNVTWHTDEFGNISASTTGGGGGSLSLETNGTPNGSQTLLNLVAGSNVTLTDNGSGSVTVATVPLPPNQINIVQTYNASGAGATTTTTVGSTVSGTSVVVASSSTWTIGNGIYIPGAGVAGAAYIGVVTHIAGTTLTVSPAISTTVVNGTAVQHDETAAFLAAIGALGSIPGGGIIWVPAGLYLVNGPLLDTSGANAVLPMPVVPNYDPNLVTISIRGMSPGGLIPTAGAVIQTSQNTGNFFGGYDIATGGGFSPFTNVRLDLQELFLMGPSNPGLTMVNARTILDFTHKNLAIQTISGALPSNTAGVGIRYPEVGNGTHLVGEGYLTIVGYYTGLVTGEHLTINTAYIVNYVNAVIVDNGNNAGAPSGYQGNTVHINYVWFGPGTNQLVAGSNKTALQIDTADFEEGTGLAVNDPSNLIYGFIQYNVPVTANGYSYTSLPKSGGTNLVTIPLWGSSISGLSQLAVGTPVAVPAGVGALISAGDAGGGTGGAIVQEASSNTTDAKIWDQIVFANRLVFRTVNDAYNAANNWLSITRVGDVPQLAAFGCPIATPIYSAAGTPLPAATAGLSGARAVVSDATTPTFLGAYVSGGAVVSPVLCNGTIWITA